MSLKDLEIKALRTEVKRLEILCNFLLSQKSQDQITFEIEKAKQEILDKDIKNNVSTIS